jgi:hypothetical protein
MMISYREDAMAEQTTTFLLRISPEIKEAVRMLSNAAEYMDYGNIPRRTSTPFDSMNATFISLIELGMLEMNKYIFEVIDETQKFYLKPLSEIMMFFLSNPTTEFCSVDDFEKGSTARGFIEDTIKDHPKMAERGLSRSWASDAYAFEQRRRMALESTSEEIIKSYNAGVPKETSQILIDELIHMAETDPHKGTEDRSAFLSEATKQRTREIGAELLKIGGMKLMIHARKEVQKRHGVISRNLDFAWNGIGSWEA